jgi:hypothetical protein
MAYEPFKEHTFVYEYDFAVEGGAVGAISLRNLGLNGLEAGLAVEDIQLRVQTALTSGGSATVTLGHVGDPDGYFVDFFSLASANATLRIGEVAGALVWDDTNDHQISHRIASAANANPTITIGTAALTAGKFQVTLICRAY